MYLILIKYRTISPVIRINKSKIVGLIFHCSTFRSGAGEGLVFPYKMILTKPAAGITQKGLTPIPREPARE